MYLILVYIINLYIKNRGKELIELGIIEKTYLESL